MEARQQQHRTFHQAGLVVGQHRLAVSIAALLAFPQRAVLIVAALAGCDVCRRDCVEIDRRGEELVQSLPGPQPCAPARGQLVEQQPVGRPGRIGERAHEGRRPHEPRQVVDGVSGAFLCRLQAQDDTRILGNALVDLQLTLLDCGGRKQAVALAPERQRVGDCLVPLLGSDRGQRPRQRAPFEL